MKPGWKRLSKRTCGGTWEFKDSGFRVCHCGHPTAHWPYYGIKLGSRKMILAPNGRGFRLLKDAQSAVEVEFFIRKFPRRHLRGTSCSSRLHVSSGVS